MIRRVRGVPRSRRPPLYRARKSEFKRDRLVGVGLTGRKPDTNGPLPAKRDLLRYAREHDAPEDVLDDLNRLPDGRFDTWDEVTDALGAPR